MPAFSPVRRSARVAARVVPFDPVAEALRPQSAHKVKKPKAFYIELTGGVAVSHAWRDRYVRLLTLSSRIASELLITFAPKQDLS